jgi:hydrogenase maturation protein HypF
MQVISLPFKVKKEILATGADMKGRFCFAKGKRAYISDDFGDLSEVGNRERYEKEIEKARRKFGFKPCIVACDLHPGYFSTKFAQTNNAIRDTHHALRYIQHHHAHVASCMVDNKMKGAALGVSFDGTGFGTDGMMWGGEFLLVRGGTFQRVAHLDYTPMPGGEKAVVEPWRMALAYLYKTFQKSFTKLSIPFMKRLDRQKGNVLVHMIENNVNTPLTSSIGRLFDGVSSLAGIRDHVDYEAQAAIELERMADPACKDYYGYELHGDVLRLEGIIGGVVADLRKKTETSIISSRFHNTIARLVGDVVTRVTKKENVTNVVLSGGVFQNRFLVHRLKERFATTKLRVYFHNNFATTDASIALGQIAVANAMR